MGRLLGECYAASSLKLHQDEITPLASFRFYAWDASHTLFNWLLTARKGMKAGSRAHVIVSQWILDCLLYRDISKTRPTYVTIQELKQLYIDAQKFPFNNTLLQKITVAEPLDESSVEFFEWLGNRIDGVWYSGIGGRSLWQAVLLAQAYINNPNRKGLLAILGGLALSGSKLSIPSELLNENDLETDNHRFSAFLIRLAEGSWDESEAKKLAQGFTSLRDKSDHLWMGFEMLDNHSRKTQAKESFGLALLDQLDPSRFDDHSHAIAFLDKLMRQRRSKITNAAKWKECGLPLLA
jgi:hypothetical protein